MIVKNSLRIAHEDLKNCDKDKLSNWDIKYTINNINKLMDECELDKRYIDWSGNDNWNNVKNISYYYEQIIINLIAIKNRLLDKIKEEAYLEQLNLLGLRKEVK